MPPKSVFDIDDVCERIETGEWSMRAIAKHYGVTCGALTQWLATDPERSARARQSRIAAAEWAEEQAQKLLASVQFSEKDKSSFELAKAKELAHHYRWKASKIAPSAYGDKVAVGGDADAPPIQTAIQVTFVDPKGVA